MGIMSNAKVIQFNPKQAELFKSKSPIVLAHGPAGNGKSTIAQEKIHLFLKTYPGAQGLLIRKTYESTINSVVLRYQEEIMGREPKLVKWDDERKRFEYSNGSYLFVGGVRDKKQRDALKSMGRNGAVDIIWVEEATELIEHDFDELTARNRGYVTSWRQIILTCNPDSPDHWIHQRLIEGGKAHCIWWRTEDNPRYANDKEYIDSLKNLSPLYRARLYDGKWVGAEGTVFPDFRHSIHVVEDFIIPHDWKRYRTIDFGYKDPSVCAWYAENPINGNLYMYKEIYKTGLTIAEFSNFINEVNDGDNIEYTVADHHLENRASLSRAGIATLPANKDIAVGIKTLTQRLRYTNPKIFFFAGSLAHPPDEELIKQRKPKSGIEEFSGYVWNKKPNRGIVDVPVDKDNHFIDATRYLCMALDQSNVGAAVITSEDVRRVRDKMIDNDEFKGIMVF